MADDVPNERVKRVEKPKQQQQHSISVIVIERMSISLPLL